ncbi:putative proteasome subunit, beta type, 7 [Dioszegia hungarica]|uniref:proteasome endopeptidase complex n=1 Tax=Dioszegia hungarica TaxID=4972 RepID=A0AA38H9G2_9TREE|nr:putative proteasome subunit, beta type, 7 [Dioszegia hungarica]KAI9635299.1 putative proteasome subunit, beta type, 7 [Dioszegia hungarica]
MPVEGPSIGFDFSNYARNQFLGERMNGLPRATSTGTTIVGLKFGGGDTGEEEGICLGADTRATGGPIVADKNCEKIHYLAPHMRCCGAGTAADTEFVTNLISSNLELHAYSQGRPARVVTAMTMLKQYLFRYQGQVGAYLVLGGVDSTGAHLFTIHAHGSTDKLPYVTMGSGSMAAMAVFESSFKQHMTRKDAIDLVARAIRSGIFNDLGSGSNVDVSVITKNGTEMMRNYETPNERGIKSRNYKFRRGTTAWTKESIRSLIVSEEVKMTTGAGKTQDGVLDVPVPIGKGPGGEEGMDVDA